MGTIQGFVEAKSQYGIKINGEWYNEDRTHKGCLANIEKGDYVTTTYIQNNQWRNATKAEKTTAPPQQEELSKQNPPEERISQEPEKDLQIVRQACLKAAAAITANINAENKDLAKETINIAEVFVTWVKS